MKPGSARRYRLILGLAVCLFANSATSTFAGADEPAPARLRLCVLPLQNAAGNAALNHWSETCQIMIETELSDFKSLWIMPTDSVDYGIREAKVDVEGAITPEQARRIGQELQVSRVIWGRFNRRDQDWEMAVRIGKMADQTVSKEFTATGRNWNSVVVSIESQLLAELETKPGQLHRDKPSPRWVTSPEALDSYSQARADKLQLPKAEEELQRAIQLDPKFVQAYVGLAATLGNEGKFDSSKKVIQQALTLDPDNPVAHDILGAGLMIQNLDSDLDGAVEELRKAIEHVHDI